MRYDDTSSEDEKPQTKKSDNNNPEPSKKVEHKKQDEFVSITDKYQKGAEEKLSKVNEIIKNAKVEEKP